MYHNHYIFTPQIARTGAGKHQVDTTPYISLDLNSVPTQRKKIVASRYRKFQKLKKSKIENRKSPQVGRSAPELRASVRDHYCRQNETQHDTNLPIKRRRKVTLNIDFWRF